MKKKMVWIILVAAVVLAVLYCVNHMVNTSNDGEPEKGSVTVDDGTTMPAPKPDVKDKPPGIPDMEIINNELLELPVNADTGRKLLCGSFLYPDSRVIYESRGIEVNSVPQVEFRFWKRENHELASWDGEIFYVKPKSGEARSFNGFLWHEEPGKIEEGLVAMDGVRFSVLPADFKQEGKPNARNFLQLGQEYIIDCRGEGGKPIGRDQIKVPETLDKNQVVVFNVIVNEYDPPLPKVYTFKGKINGYKHKPGSYYVAIISNGEYYSRTYLNKKGEFSFSSGNPIPRGLTVYIEGSGAEEPLYAISKPIQGNYVEFPRDAAYLAEDKDLINVNVIISSGCIPPEKKVLYYYLTYADKKVMLADKKIFFFDLAKVYEEEFDAFRKNRTLKFRCLPGEYAIFGGWEIGKDPQRFGTVKVTSADNGKTLTLSPAK